MLWEIRATCKNKGPVETDRIPTGRPGRSSRTESNATLAGRRISGTGRSFRDRSSATPDGPVNRRFARSELVGSPTKTSGRREFNCPKNSGPVEMEQGPGSEVTRDQSNDAMERIGSTSWNSPISALDHLFDRRILKLPVPVSGFGAAPRGIVALGVEDAGAVVVTDTRTR